MRKTVAALIVFALLSCAPAVKANQLLYYNFDDIRIAAFDTDYSTGTSRTGNFTKVASYQIVLPSQQYLSGVTVTWEAEYGLGPDGSGCGNSAQIKVTVNGQEQTGTERSGFSQAKYTETFHFNMKNSTFLIEIYVKTWTCDNDDFIQVTIDKTTVYTSTHNITITSLNQNTQYLPPGADRTPQGFILNHTEVLLPKQYSLPEGTIKFWLKWDGTAPLNITDSIGIDSNGQLYVKSTSSTYTLQGITPSSGVYIPVVISWKEGYGYILMNSTVLRLSWQGNLSLSKIGDISQESGALIDEFILLDTFVDENYALQLTGQDYFLIKAGERTFKVVPDGGNHLPVPITLSFYNGQTLLGTETWYGSQETIPAPNGTNRIILSSGAGSTIVSLDSLDSDIAMLSSDAKGVIEQLTIIPSEKGVLTVKNAAGYTVYSDNASTTHVIGVYGSTYYIRFTQGGTTRAAGWFTFTGQGITLVLSSKLTNATGIFADAWIENGTLKLELVDTVHPDPSWNITMEYFSQAAMISNYTLLENSTHYLGTFIPPDGAISAVIHIKGVKFSKTMNIYIANQESQTIPDTVFPAWLLLGLFGIGGLLIAPARYKFLSPLLATAILSFASLAKIFTPPAWLIGTLMSISILSLIIYRPSSR